MSLQSLLSRVSALQDSLKSTTAQIARLSKLSPAEAPPTADQGPAATEPTTLEDLTLDIHDTLKSLAEDLAVLQVDAADLPAPRRPTPDTLAHHARLHTSLTHLAEDLKSARARFRRAQLAARSNAQASARRERDAYLAHLQAAGATSQQQQQQAQQPEQTPAQQKTALFAGRRNATGSTKRDPHATQQDILLSATSDVTASLRRTHALLTSELGRSRFAQETLDASNAALTELSSRYGSLNDMLQASRGLVTTLMRSNKSDSWYLETAMWVLVATLAWLAYRRLLHGLVWLFIYLPLVNMVRAGLWFSGAAVGLVGRDRAAEQVASLTRQAWAAGSRPAATTSVGAVAAAAASGERSPPGSLSDEVGRMAEAATQSGARVMATEPAGAAPGASEEQNQTGQRQQQAEGQEQPPQVRRGDQQPLRERQPGEKPNPKKRMFEADKEGAARDEL